MRINIKPLKFILLVAIVGFTAISPGKAKAEDHRAEATTTPPPRIPLKQSNGQKINELAENVSSINERLMGLETQLSNERRVADVNKQVSELKNSVADGKKTAFDHDSTLLNILIGLTALVITALGVAFAVLAVLGFKDIKGMRQEISNDLIRKHQENINDLYSKVASNIRDDFNKDLLELSTKVDVLGLQLRQIANGENPVALNAQIDNPKSKENAFDE